MRGFGPSSHLKALQRLQNSPLLHSAGEVSAWMLGPSQGMTKKRRRAFRARSWHRPSLPKILSPTNPARTSTAARLVVARADIDLASRNASDEIASTGSYPGAMPSYADFTAVYGVEEGGERYREFRRRIDAGRQAFDMRAMPNQSIHAALRDSASAMTTLQGEVRSDYGLLAEAAKKTLRARTADPGAYVRRVFPVLDEAWKNVSDTKGHQSAILLAASAQHQLGMEDIQPLPNSVAEGAIMALIGNKAQADEAPLLSRSLWADMSDPYLRLSLIKQLIFAAVSMSL